MSSVLEEPVAEQVIYKLNILFFSFNWVVKWDLDLSQGI